MLYCRSNILSVLDRALSQMIPHLCLCFLQSRNKCLINQACLGPYWKSISPRSFLYGPRCTQSVLTRPQGDILPVRPSHLVNIIYVLWINRQNKKYSHFDVVIAKLNDTANINKARCAKIV